MRLLAGQDPVTGRLLGRELKPGTVAGFDLTFRSPKSVGVLSGVGDPELAAEIRGGHEAAVSAALEYLEREACVVRRGKGGAVELPRRGFVAGGVRAPGIARRRPAAPGAGRRRWSARDDR